MSKKSSTAKKNQKAEVVAEQKPAETQATAVAQTPSTVVATPVAADAKVEAKAAPKKEKKPRTAKPKKAAKPAQAAGGAEEDQEEGRRYFKCIYNGETQGRYCGDKPKQAANKAFTVIVRNYEGNCIGVPIKFQMVECTRGSSRKMSNYSGVRTELKEPLKVQIKKNTAEPKVIEYKFANKISKVKEQVAGKPEKKPTGEKKVAAKKPKKVAPKKAAPKKAAPKKAASKPKEVKAN